MASPRRLPDREELLLLLSAAGLGLAVAAAYGAYQAVSAGGEDAPGRLAEFATNLAFPGALIAVAVAAVVWFGWKANID